MPISTLQIVTLCCLAVIGAAVVAGRKLLAHSAKQRLGKNLQE